MTKNKIKIVKQRNIRLIKAEKILNKNSINLCFIIIQMSNKPRVNPTLEKKDQKIAASTGKQSNDRPPIVSSGILNSQQQSSRQPLNRPRSAFRQASKKQIAQGSNIYKGINQVLKYQFKNSISYYVPCYMRMRVMRVNQINYIESKAEIEAQVRIWLQIKQFPQCVQEQIINQAKLQINSTNKIQFENIREPKKLDQSQIKNLAKNAVGFMYSEKMQLNIQSDPFWSPYEQVKLFANIQIKKITLGQGNPDLKKKFMDQIQDWQAYWQRDVQFNFIDANSFLQFAFQVGKLGCFDIIQRDVDMKYSSDSINDQLQDDLQNQNQAMLLVQNSIQLKLNKMKQGEITPDAYQHGQITIPLYKYPSTTIINVFLPLFIVGIMSYGVFFEDNDMSNRDQGLAAYLLSYIAFLPTIRENLPQTPKLVFTQILVYMQVICSLICFFYSLYVNGDENYSFVWNESPAFLACMIITIINISVVVAMFLHHKIIKQPQYNTISEQSKLCSQAKTINTDNHREWNNKDCEKQFSEFVRLGYLRPYKYKIVNQIEDNAQKSKNNQPPIDEEQLN